MSAAKKAARDIRRTRQARTHSFWGHLVITPVSVAYNADISTILRTFVATGACIAVPDTPHCRQALTVGDSRDLARRCCIQWINTGKDRWIRLQRQTAVVEHEVHGEGLGDLAVVHLQELVKLDRAVTLRR